MEADGEVFKAVKCEGTRVLNTHVITDKNKAPRQSTSNCQPSDAGSINATSIEGETNNATRRWSPGIISKRWDQHQRIQRFQRTTPPTAQLCLALGT